MKILTATEMRAADQEMFQEIGVPSRTVMESAGREVAQFVLRNYRDAVDQGALILAGGGNNGGDGLVAARVLLGLGLRVEVLILKKLDALKGDVFDNAQSYLRAGGKLKVVDENNWLDEQSLIGIGSFGLIIDAIFGTGFKGNASGFFADLFKLVNRQAEVFSIPIVSIDLPSGINADTALVSEPVIQAKDTLALQCLKIAHVIFPAAKYCGSVSVLDIGLPKNLQQISAVDRELLTEDGVSELARRNFTFSDQEHKGTRGHILVIGGGAGHFGAPRLSAIAALRMGAGLATVLMPGCSASWGSGTRDELMQSFHPADSDGNFSGENTEKILDLLNGKQAVVIGPGMGVVEGSRLILKEVLRICSKQSIPTVIDADALNILALEGGFSSLWPEVVLTPHPGEMARLLNCSTQAIQENRLSVALELSNQAGCWVVLKGARTIIAGPQGEVRVNPAAISILATAGSGDVLSGMIGTLLARGISCKDAASLAVFVHGCAGEYCALMNRGLIGALAEDFAEAGALILNALLSCENKMQRLTRSVLPNSMSNIVSQLLP